MSQSPQAWIISPAFSTAPLRKRCGMRCSRSSRLAPPFRPRMPRTGKPFSVWMSNCGALGWVSDERGYRYQPTHPGNGAPVAGDAAAASRRLRRARPGRAAAGGLPDQPLRFRRAYGPAPGSRRGGACRARWSHSRSGTRRSFASAELQRNAPTRSFRLASGDAMSLAGEGRLAFHGVDRIIAGSSTLLPQGGRINLDASAGDEASA